jgi:hypothetical protein
MTTSSKNGYGSKAELTDEFKRFAAHYGCEFVFANPYQPAEKGGVENSADTAGDILTPIMDVKSFSEVNDMLLKESMHYIETAGPVGMRPRSVKEMTEEERPFLLQLPAKRYETFTTATVKVNNQQLLTFEGMTYSVPRQYAEKKVGIKAYPYRIDFLYVGHLIWTCDRPLFKDENRIYAEHFMFDLKTKPRSRENARPLLEGILPGPLSEFRTLCKSKNKYNQLYMVMAKMDEIGQDKLFEAVDAVNAKGSPTYEKVMEYLQLEDTPDPPGQESSDIDDKDELFVKQHDLNDYDIFDLSPRS